MHECRYLKRSEEGIGYSVTEVASDCEPPNMGAGIQTHALCKSSTHI